jgi:methyl-accepting chemotaxis protein
MAEAAGGGLVGTLYIRLVGQNDDLNKKMEESESKVKKHSKGMEEAAHSLMHVLGALGLAFGIHEIVDFIKETIHATDELKKLSEELGISIEKLAGFQFAAEKANIGDQTSIPTCRRTKYLSRR